MLLCCGEALIDMISAPTENGTIGFVPHAGGALFNTAIGLGRLGVNAGFLSGVSSDLFGQQIRAELQKSNVDISLLCLSDRPTTLAFVHLIDGQANYSFYDENSAGRSLDPGDFPPVPDAVSALYFGGISLAGEPGATAYAALCAQEHDKRVVMLDPNIRADFIQNEQAYRARLARMISQSDIVKVSDEDLDWLISGEDSSNEKARSLLKDGPKIVILTCGSAGATGFHNNGYEVSVPVPRVDVIDTVGAGDTFNAGFLAKLSQLKLLSKDQLLTISEEDLEQALSYGAQVAAITVTRAGANPPWANEVKACSLSAEN
ncbi:carbohydrate kinase family protein [Cohaesibacter gelatinilyticus]|uniref:Fructokinase n=1 Tax=Cohaesibacter gelatinilyticus TaxID=372072 RepID=A0A285PCJ5_9HYPH|nr:carbohydrate kinase [Cohaesibacter gelatinilyticus]SNZ19158.1 fructokinase [Cohaesibacter gelatinilyticus]